MVQTHPPSDPLSSFGRVNAHFDSFGKFVPVQRLVVLEPARGEGGPPGTFISTLQRRGQIKPPPSMRSLRPLPIDDPAGIPKSEL